jgi:hypothetical protein
MRPNLLDISDLKSDELDCGLLGHHPQQESWGSISSHHKKNSPYGQFKAGNYRTPSKLSINLRSLKTTNTDFFMAIFLSTSL